VKIFDQLKTWIKDNCSLYPVDYHAEVTQFMRNFPYREYQISGFIRKINYKSDFYPIHFGEMDKGEVDDDIEA
jgi:sulfur relay (sulfurtransferase) DsrC/TusE family protein